MKTINTRMIIALAGTALLIASCSELLIDADTALTNADVPLLAESAAAICDSCTFSGDITTTEAAGLMEMREEEKLAQDVYTYLYGMYDLQVFGNIAKSESAHTNAVLNLITGYGLEDPALPGAGEFSQPLFAGLYQQLILKGSENLIEALKVGAYIEEYDIADLKKLLEETQNADIKRVYGHLLSGSENHLRAFTAVLKLQGVTYVPSIISAEEYLEILSGD